MMIGWDILNKDNSFSFFFKLFRPLRSFCLSNRLSAFCFRQPRPFHFFRPTVSFFPSSLVLLSPSASPPVASPFAPSNLQTLSTLPSLFRPRRTPLFLFSPPALQSPLFSPALPASPASPVPPASPAPPAPPAPPAQPFPPLFFCPPRPSFLPPPFRPVLFPLSLFPERFAPFPPPGRRRPPRAADDW